MKRCPSCGTHYPDDANFCPVDAKRLATEAGGADAEPGADTDLLAGRFQLAEKFASGQTGDLYAATDTETGKAAVVKVVHLQVFPSPQHLQRAERELQQLVRVDVETVCQVLAHGRDGERFWFATERVDGAPLSRVIAEHGPMSFERARHVIARVGQALAAAAQVGVVHRDVSPGNVVLGPADRVKVINFGIATPVTAEIQGTPEFLSPEQVEGKQADQRANIYSLGALLYYVITGTPPYTGAPKTVLQSHLTGTLQPPSRRSPGIPSEADAITAKALERMASRRYMTLQQMLDELTGGGSGKGVAVPQAPGGTPAAARTMIGGFSPFADGAGVAPPASPAPAAKPAPAAAQKPAALIVEPPAATRVSKRSAQVVAPAAAHAASAVEPPSPAMPAPSVPPGAAAGAGGGKRRHAGEGQGDTKGRFRETLWFKKGELDAVAAEAAAAAAKHGKEPEAIADRADALPMEDRYKDDGTLTREDRAAFSLRTGHTQTMRAVDPGNLPGRPMGEDDMIEEMRSGRGKVLAAIAVGVLLCGALIGYFVLR